MQRAVGGHQCRAEGAVVFQGQIGHEGHDEPLRFLLAKLILLVVDVSSGLHAAVLAGELTA